MISNKQKERAKIFSDMHKEKHMFVLPNIWNVGSAYVFEKQGFRAVATSSAGVAYDLGYPDGEDILFDDLLDMVEKITKRIEIPLSVDFERGYGKTIEQVQDNARRLIEAGAVGVNIEDGLPDFTLNSLDVQIEIIKALVELKKEMELDFVINARTCAYWLNVADDETKLKIALERGNAYRAAGADCVFVPGAIDEVTIEKLTRGIRGPINIILNSKLNDYKRLDQLGVRRLSVGSAPARLIYHQLIHIAENLQDGKVSDLVNNEFSYRRANQYFEK